jgi:hypothetical protein
MMLRLGIVILVLMGWGCSSPQPESYEPDRRFSLEQVKDDLIQLGEGLQAHPAAGRLAGSDGWERRISGLIGEIAGPLSLLQCYYLAGRLVEPLSCGHTYPNLPAGFHEYGKNHHKHFPFELFFRADQAYVVTDYTEAGIIPLGSEIVSVNDEPMNTICGRMRTVITSDGPSAYKDAKMNRRNYGLFPGYPRFPEQYRVTYVAPGDSMKRTAVVEGRLPADIITVMKRLKPERWDHKAYDYEVIDSPKVAVITVRDFVVFPEEKYRRFLEAAFKRIRHEHINHMILDVRGNDGGDPARAAELLSYLADRRIIYFDRSVYGYRSLKKLLSLSSPGFRGQLYILMDAGCFSTTGHLLSLLKYHHIGVLVGEASGGSFSCYGCPKTITLANTGISVDVQRCVFRTEVSGFKPSRGVEPDIEVQPTIIDIVNGCDTVKQHVLDMIRADLSSSQ